MKINFPYTGVELTTSINLTPSLPRWLSSLGVFGISKGVSTTVVGIGISADGRVVILEKKPRGDKGQALGSKSQQKRFIEIPHYPATATITPDDLQDMLKNAESEMTSVTFEDEMMDMLADLRSSHDLTREKLRWGAVKGMLADASGDILDLYSVLGQNQTTINFALDTAGTDVKAKCAAVVEHVSKNLKGESFTGIEVPVGKTFFDKLKNHSSVKEAYGQWSHSTQLTDPVDIPFNFGGLNFRRVLEYYPNKNGEPTPVIDDNKGHPILLGTRKLYVDHNGPAHHISMVNQPGQDIVISEKILDHGEGVELKSQSNPLPVCTQPGAIPQLLEA
jgi:major capsid protein E